MENLILKCSLTRCNVDGSDNMTIEKCLYDNGSPCYYILTESNQATPSDDAWQKFDQFVDKSKKKMG